MTEPDATAASEKPLVAAVVVAWNDAERTVACLDALATVAYEPLTVIVVDNGSTDDTADRVAAAHPAVQLVPLENNRGFPGGVNAGIERARSLGADYCWLLNDDVFVEDSSVPEALVDHVRSVEDAGAVTPRLLDSAGDVWFEGGYLDRPRVLAGHESHRRWYIPPVTPAERTSPDGRVVATPYLPLACTMLSMAAIDDVGPLPERYFLYGADVAYCARVRDAGWQLLVDRSLSVCHEVSASTGIRSPTLSYYATRNWWLLRAEQGFGASPAFYPLHAYWVLAHLADRLLHREFGSAGAMLRGVLDGIRGVEGRGPYP